MARKPSTCFTEAPAWPAFFYRSGERIHVIGRFHFLVKSKSEDGWHVVDLEPVDDDWPEGGCSCQGYQARRECRHVNVIKQHLGMA